MFFFSCRIAKRFGLRSKSYGKNEDRFITISRKFDANQLIEELKRQGGSTEKYDLICPIWELWSIIKILSLIISESKITCQLLFKVL